MNLNLAIACSQSFLSTMEGTFQQTEMRKGGFKMTLNEILNQHFDRN